MCHLKTFAVLAITSASEYSKDFDSDNATSFWNARRTPLPFLWAWSSGISANNLSFNLVVLTLGISTPSCARRCWYNWEISERGKTVGSFDCRLVSIIWFTNSKRTSGYASGSSLVWCESFSRLLRCDLSLFYKAVRKARWYFSSWAMPPRFLNNMPSFSVWAHSCCLLSKFMVITWPRSDSGNVLTHMIHVWPSWLVLC